MATSVASSERTAAAESARILVVDDERSMREMLSILLKREGHDVPAEQLSRDVTAPIEPSAEVQRILIEVYRKDPKTSELCERLVDLDEGMQEWRYRHVKMVERTIGAKPGTGGSAGAEYLRTTLARAAFPDLWEIRASL